MWSLYSWIVVVVVLQMLHVRSVVGCSGVGVMALLGVQWPLWMDCVRCWWAVFWEANSERQRGHWLVGVRWREDAWLALNLV